MTPSASHPAAPNPGSAQRVPLVLIGGGGHAIVVAEAARLSEHPIAGFLDDHPAAPLAAILIDLPHPFAAPSCLGPLEAVELVGEQGWIVALGDLRARRAAIKRMTGGTGGAKGGAVSVVHPTAIVSPTALIGPGTFIGPGAIVHARARVGAHGVVNSGAIVEHDCVLEENVHIAPGAVLAGGVKVGRDTLVGLGSRVLPQVRIGQLAVVGAGSVVLGDVGDGVTVVGVPAGPVG